MKSEEQVLRLPDDESNIVRIFLCWIYRNRIVVPVLEEEDTHGEFRGPCGYLVKLWIFGDKYQIKSSQNDAIDGLVKYYEDDSIPAEIVALYMRTHHRPRQDSVSW